MQLTVSNKARSGKRKNQSSILGIDIGCSSIKMARIARTNSGFRIANRLVLPFEDQAFLDLPSLVESGQLRKRLSVLSEQPLRERQTCCCVVSMSATEFRSVEVPDGSQTEVELMARESFRDSLPDFDERIVKTWKHTQSPHGMAMVSGISMPVDLSETIVHELGRAGLDCISLHSQPFALAGAMSLMSSDSAPSTIGLLSWEHTNAFFVAIHNGRVEFVRTLRDCGGHAVLKRIAEGLQLSQTDAASILMRFGVAGSEHRSDTSGIVDFIQQIIHPELQNICYEFRKTLTYLQHHLPALLPEQIRLFGGMGIVPNLSSLMEAECDIPTLPWSLNASNSLSTDPLFAGAIAASHALHARHNGWD